MLDEIGEPEPDEFYFYTKNVHDSRGRGCGRHFRIAAVDCGLLKQKEGVCVTILRNCQKEPLTHGIQGKNRTDQQSILTAGRLVAA